MGVPKLCRARAAPCRTFSVLSSAYRGLSDLSPERSEGSPSSGAHRSQSGVRHGAGRALHLNRSSKPPTRPACRSPSPLKVVAPDPAVDRPDLAKEIETGHLRERMSRINLPERTPPAVTSANRTSIATTGTRAPSARARALCGCRPRRPRGVCSSTPVSRIRAAASRTGNLVRARTEREAAALDGSVA